MKQFELYPVGVLEKYCIIAFRIFGIFSRCVENRDPVCNEKVVKHINLLPAGRTPGQMMQAGSMTKMGMADAFWVDGPEAQRCSFAPKAEVPFAAARVVLHDAIAKEFKQKPVNFP